MGLGRPRRRMLRSLAARLVTAGVKKKIVKLLDSAGKKSQKKGRGGNTTLPPAKKKKKKGGEAQGRFYNQVAVSRDFGKAVKRDKHGNVAGSLGRHLWPRRHPWSEDSSTGRPVAQREVRRQRAHDYSGDRRGHI
eukprot:TRINITY_DN5191_c0_g3_i1.p2 TRINITY_DN5191_c0_g3~~TRINITY_DN5191_c0_g3_i1.p2  ORF type:complete len:135 (-),score=11.02 TRINITY_DN5191_c0_g3_i1:156-560(-)